MVNDLFTYNVETNKAEINKPDLLLIKEFKALFDYNRNKCKEDKTGKEGLRAFRELVYINQMLNWKSPYAEDDEQDRHESALADADMTEEEFNDPVFREACRKYQSLQNSSRSLKLIKSAQNMVDKFTDYFDSVDLFERDNKGAVVFKAKDVMQEMGKVSDVIDALKMLEQLYKKEQEQDENKNVRGDVAPGVFD